MPPKTGQKRVNRPDDDLVEVDISPPVKRARISAVRVITTNKINKLTPENIVLKMYQMRISVAAYQAHQRLLEDAIPLNTVGLTTQEMALILLTKQYDSNMQAFIRYNQSLYRFGFSYADMASILSSKGGANALTALAINGQILLEIFPIESIVVMAHQVGSSALFDFLGSESPWWSRLDITNEEVIPVAYCPGANQILRFIKKHGRELLDAPISLTKDNLLLIARHIGANQTLRCLKNNWHILTAAPISLTKDELVKIASQQCANKALTILKDNWITFTEGPMRLTKAILVSIASRKGANQILSFLKENHAMFDGNGIYSIWLHEMFARYDARRTSSPSVKITPQEPMISPANQLTRCEFMALIHHAMSEIELMNEPNQRPVTEDNRGISLSSASFFNSSSSRDASSSSCERQVPTHYMP